MAESEKSTGLGFRKWIILAVVYIETFFHTRLLFGWTLIKNIYKKDGYFLPECLSDAHLYEETCNATLPPLTNATCGRPQLQECGYDGCDFDYQNKQLTDILTLGGALLGWCILVSGFIRDNYGFGWNRLFCYACVGLPYFMLLMATPQSTDGVLFAWVLQMMGAIPLYINDIELGKMFPGKQSFYTSCLDAMACLSIMVPKFWQQWFDDCVDFKIIEGVWGMLCVTFITGGFFILPWFSLPKTFDPERDEIRTVFTEVKDRKLTGARCGGLIPPKIKDTSSGEGFSLGTAIRLLFSPLWLIIVTVYIFGHLLNFYGAGNVEHLARMHLPAEWRAENWNPEKPEVNPEYEEDAYQFIENVKSTFTTMGFLVGVTLTPAVGAFADWLKATIKSKYGTRHLGVRSSLFIVILEISLIFVHNVCIRMDSTFGMWIALFCVTASQSMTYIMVILSVPLSFPMSYMGVVIGGVKAFGGTFTIFLHGLHHMIHEQFYTFNMYYLIASAVLYVLVLIQMSIAFDKAPGPIKAMDRKRFEMMEADEAQESPAKLPNDEKIALTSEN